MSALKPSGELHLSLKSPAETTMLNINETAPLLGPAPVKKPASSRVFALDVFRGLTIVLMMFVDNRGNPDYVYWPFNETVWNGLSTADLVFPWFLLIMGTAIALALQKNRYEANSQMCRDTGVWYRVVRRFVVLFLMGVFFNAQALKFRSHFRIMGVLERLGLCYFICATLWLTCPRWVQRGVIAAFVTLWLALTYGLNVPGCGRGVLTPECNAGAYIDRSIFTCRFMICPNDPEGLVSSLTATLTCYMGVELGAAFIAPASSPSAGLFPELARDASGAGAASAKREKHARILRRWLGIGLAALVLSLALLPVMHFNKKMYTLSFALFTVGSGAIVLSALYAVCDVVTWPPCQRAVRVVTRPLLWIGSNPLALFLTMLELEVLLMDNITVACGAARCTGSTSLWNYIYWVVFQTWIPDLYLASFVMSVFVLLLFVAMAYVMQRQGWYLKL